MTKPAFDHCSNDYARFRPGYPEGVIDLIARETGVFPDPIVVDVGAGTGIFSTQLSRRGFRVVAIEPSRTMLEHIAAEASRVPRPEPRAQDRGPDTPIIGSPSSKGDGPPRTMPERGAAIRCLRATAEQTAIAPASIHAVACAQSFHWFNPPYALAEFARILVDGGLLAMVWNNRDADNAFVAAFNALIARWNESYRREYRKQEWAAKAAASGLFEPMQVATFRWTWRVPQEDFVGLTRSVSYIRNVLRRESVPSFEADLRNLMREHFSQNDCAVPMTTEAWWTHRKPR